MSAETKNKLLSQYYRVPPGVFPVAGLLLAFVAGGLLILVSGFPPLQAYAALIQSAFGSKNGIAQTLIQAAPLILASLGVAIAFKGNLLNIGAEGQLYMGAIGATFVGLFLGDLSPVVGIPLAIGMGFLLGAIWAGIAIFFKLKFGANEIIITLMMNYIAIEIAYWLISGPWKDPEFTEPFSAIITSGARLPVILPGSSLHAGILVAVIATVAIAWVMSKTVFGFQLAVMGASNRVADYAGIKTARLMLTSMLLGGGLAGLAGVCEVAGVQHRLIENLSPGYGYTAIAIAMLGNGNPWGILVASILFAGLDVGVQGMQQYVSVPVSAAEILKGLVLLFVVVGLVLSRRQEITQRKRKLIG
jgi:simple sugar transport system permease protein